MISTVITSANEKDTLLRAIRSNFNNLKSINKDWEIIIVSPDQESKKIVKEFNNPRIKYLKDKGNGKPAALNQAFNKVKGDIIVLTDGDVRVACESFKHLIKNFKDPKVGAVTGRPVTSLDKNSLFGYWSWFLTQAAHSMRIRSKKFPCSGYLYGIRNNLVSKIPENSLADDGVITNMIREQSFKIKYQPKAKVYVKYPTNFKDWLKQKIRSTGGYIQKQTGSDRNLFQEIKGGVELFFQYPDNLKEFYWTILLFLARIYLWLLIFWNIKIKNKTFKQLWQRIESTK